MLQPTTITDILTNADSDDITQVYAACKTRHRALAQMTAATLRTDAPGRTKGLSPKYLNGLTGTIVSTSSIRLDETSTRRLRFSGRRFYVAPEVTEYLLGGIPAGCLENV